MKTFATIAQVLVLIAVATTLIGVLGLLVQTVRKKARRPWGVVAGGSAVAVVVFVILGMSAARSLRATNYEKASALMAEGNPRAAIPLLVRLSGLSYRDAPQKLAEARRIVKADVTDKLNAAAAKSDADPAAAKEGARSAMLGVDQDLLGDEYPNVRLLADDITERAEARVKQPAVAGSTAAIAGARPQPEDTGPWAERLGGMKPDDCWPLFDDLAKAREDRAVESLKEASPATWSSQIASAKAKAAAARKEERDALASQRFLFALRSEDDRKAAKLNADELSYDAKTGSFQGAIPGVLHLEGEHDASWWIALGIAPTVKTEADTHAATDQFHASTMYSYRFVGGQPLKWKVTVESSEADAFVKRFRKPEELLVAELVVVPKQGVLDRGHRATSGIKDMGDVTTGAGHAVVVDVIAWRIKSSKTDQVFASGVLSK